MFVFIQINLIGISDFSATNPFKSQRVFNYIIIKYR